MTSFVGSVGWRLTRKVKRRASPQAIEPCSPKPSGSSISPRCVPGLPWTASMKICFVFSLYSQAIAALRILVVSADSDNPPVARNVDRVVYIFILPESCFRGDGGRQRRKVGGGRGGTAAIVAKKCSGIARRFRRQSPPVPFRCSLRSRLLDTRRGPHSRSSAVGASVAAAALAER